jgi:hypothetical protein
LSHSRYAKNGNPPITPAVLILGVLASVCVVITAFALSRRIILWSMLVTSVLTGTQFILLNQTATTYLIGVSFVYSILLMLEKKIPVVRTHGFTAFVLCFQIVGYVIVNQGLSLDWSLLALAGTIIGTLAMWLQNPIKLKATMLFMGVIWTSYQIAAGAYGQLPGEAVFLTGIIVSLVMLTRARKRGIPLDEVEELPVLIRRKITSGRRIKGPAVV